MTATKFWQERIISRLTKFTLHQNFQSFDYQSPNNWTLSNVTSCYHSTKPSSRQIDFTSTLRRPSPIRTILKLQLLFRDKPCEKALQLGKTFIIRGIRHEHLQQQSNIDTFDKQNTQLASESQTHTPQHSESENRRVKVGIICILVTHFQHVVNPIERQGLKISQHPHHVRLHRNNEPLRTFHYRVKKMPKTHEKSLSRTLCSKHKIDQFPRC